MEDPEIIAEVRGGNAERFGLLVERYQRLLYYFVIGKMHEHTEAQDIVQKSFVTAYQSLATLEDAELFFPWVKGIALNHCRNAWRRRQSQAVMKDRLLEAKRAELGLLGLERVNEEGDRRIEALRVCMQRLKAEEHVLIDRRFVQELSMEQIGVELNKGAEAVRLWLYRIRMRLAECVKRRMAADTNPEAA